MNICETCKAAIEKGTKVCPYCGAPQTKWKRKTVWLTSLLLSLLIIISPLFIHVYMDSVTSPKKSIQHIIKAIDEQNMNNFYQELQMEPLDEQSTQVLFDYLMNQDQKAFEKRAIDAGMKAYKRGKDGFIFHEDGSAVFELKTSKYNFLYNKVDIKLREEMIKGIVNVSRDV